MSMDDFRSRQARAAVTAVIPIREPNPQHLGRTLASLARLTPTVDEVIVVDSTPGGFRVGTDASGCAVCSAPVADGLAATEARGIDVRVIEEEMPRGQARNVGMKRASNDLVWHLDEDTVFTRPNSLRSGLERLSEDGVAAVGGPVVAIEGNLDGVAIAKLERLVPSTLTVHHLLHHRNFCAGDRCFFVGQGRGEDLTLRSHLRQHGVIATVPEMEAEKDLPTFRQELAQRIVGSVIGGVSAVVVGKGIDAGLGRVRV